MSPGRSNTGQVIPKTLKIGLAISLLDISLLSAHHVQVRLRKYCQFLRCATVKCDWGVSYQWHCDNAFCYGNAVSATGRHHHDMAEIMLKVTLY